jgi:hypothetical protein
VVQQEVPLIGGNTSTVVRAGDTVGERRSVDAGKSHSLRHLERVGFTGAPRASGVDEKGREVLSYLEGGVDLPTAAARVTDEASAVARCCAGSMTPISLRYPAVEVLTALLFAACGWHFGTQPQVLLWCGLVATLIALALIDFDLSSPGARIYDVAYAAWTWVPLFSDRDSVTLGWHSPDRPRRLRLFADAYGLIPRDRHRLVGTIRARIVDHVEGIRRMAAAGEPAFVRIVHKGHLRRPMRDLRLIDQERGELETALR